MLQTTTWISGCSLQVKKDLFSELGAWWKSFIKRHVKNMNNSFLKQHGYMVFAIEVHRFEFVLNKNKNKASVCPI